jgi:hypothetical protein
LLPQHLRAPPISSAHVCREPVEIEATPAESPETATGVDEFVVEKFSPFFAAFLAAISIYDTLVVTNRPRDIDPIVRSIAILTR